MYSVYSPLLGNCCTHKVHILEYHRVCPLVRIRTPHPSLEASMYLPQNQGGAQSPIAVDEGVGGPNSDDWRKSLVVFFLLCG
jgi:hypothetical protein